jgi:AcrR family transcriptional regulator
MNSRLRSVAEEVKRTYRSVRRAQQAAATQAAILAAAREQFTTRGYAGTAVAAIAADAGVNVDTVYASVGRKPMLMLAVIDATLASADHPLAVEQRDYVQAVLAAATARDKLTTYAAALGRVMPKVAPLFDALAQAALTDPECAALRDSIGARRAANMRQLAADLRSTGGLRSDLSDVEVADLLWTTNAPEYYALAVARGWSPAQYSNRLADLWTRTLLGDAH